MCNPAVALGASMAALSAWGANEERKAAKSAAAAEIDAAKQSQIAQTNALAERSQQIADKGADERLARQREALRERARMRVASGSLTGNSIDVMDDRSILNENNDYGTIDKNIANQQAQNSLEYERVNAETRGRINVANSKVKRGSVGGLLIPAVQGGLSGYSMGQTLFAPADKAAVGTSKAKNRGFFDATRLRK